MKYSHWHQSWQNISGYIVPDQNLSRVSAVRKVGVNTSLFPHNEQFSFWQEYASYIGNVGRPDNDNKAFSAQSTTFFTSSITYAHHGIDNPSFINRTKAQADNSDDNALAIQLRLSGTETGHGFDCQRAFMPGDVRIMDLTKPFYLENLSYDTLGILVRKQELQDRVPNLDNLHGITLTDSPITELFKDHLKSVINTLPLVTNVEAEKLSDVTLETLSATLLLSATPNAIESDLLDVPAMRALRHYINRNMYNKKLSPELIARGIGMSRAKLFRLCKPYGTPMELVRQQRLRKARDLMNARRVRTVEEAAYMVGYGNRSGFSRAFRKEFGISARELLYS